MSSVSRCWGSRRSSQGERRLGGRCVYVAGHKQNQTRLFTLQFRSFSLATDELHSPFPFSGHLTRSHSALNLAQHALVPHIRRCNFCLYLLWLRSRPNELIGQTHGNAVIENVSEDGRCDSIRRLWRYGSRMDGGDWELCEQVGLAYVLFP